jgi:hypothetical protein
MDWMTMYVPLFRNELKSEPDERHEESEAYTNVDFVFSKVTEIGSWICVGFSNKDFNFRNELKSDPKMKSWIG